MSKIRFLCCYAYKNINDDIIKESKIIESSLETIPIARRDILLKLSKKYSLPPELVRDRTYEDDEIGIFYINPKADNTLKNLRDYDIDDKLAAYEQLENAFIPQNYIR